MKFEVTLMPCASYSLGLTRLGPWKLLQMKKLSSVE